jgi:hypothetical protein
VQQVAERDVIDQRVIPVVLVPHDELHEIPAQEVARTAREADSFATRNSAAVEAFARAARPHELAQIGEVDVAAAVGPEDEVEVAARQ